MNSKDVAALILKKSKKKLNEEYMENFKAATDHMPSHWNLVQKAWHLIHGIDIPLCQQCSQPSKFLSTSYWKWCSNKCMSSDPAVIEKKKQTNIQKWGSEYPQSLSIIKDKQKNTMIEKYGVSNYSKTESFKEQYRSVCKNRYGVDNASKSDNVREKISKSAKNRNYSKVLKKRQNTNIQKYGYATNKHVHMCQENVNKLNNIDYLIEQHVDKKKSCQQIANELGCSPTPILTRLSDAGIQISKFGTSTIEEEICDFIKNNSNFSVIRNSRNLIPPKEIDIFIPELNFAIEVNGVYWHSELYKDRYYYLDKTLQCYDKNIRLWHVFDHEWTNKKNIIRSRLNSLLKNTCKIAARKCSIQQISKRSKTKFLVDNHLQASAGSSVDLGLVYNNELVAVMTFGKSRFTKSAEWELIRFCNKLNTTVVGGASRLFNHFIKTHRPKSVVSYADYRWSNGELYKALNFDFLHRSSPNYFYFNTANPAELQSRVKYQKHKLNRVLNHFDPTLSEWENMTNNGYSRIWDCGNLVYLWENK